MLYLGLYWLARCKDSKELPYPAMNRPSVSFSLVKEVVLLPRFQLVDMHNKCIALRGEGHLVQCMAVKPSHSLEKQFISISLGREVWSKYKIHLWVEPMVLYEPYVGFGHFISIKWGAWTPRLFYRGIIYIYTPDLQKVDWFVRCGHFARGIARSFTEAARKEPSWTFVRPPVGIHPSWPAGDAEGCARGSRFALVRGPSALKAYMQMHTKSIISIYIYIYLGYSAA